MKSKLGQFIVCSILGLAASIAIMLVLFAIHWPLYVPGWIIDSAMIVCPVFIMLYGLHLLTKENCQVQGRGILFFGIAFKIGNIIFVLLVNNLRNAHFC
jgi:hypothetical protein